MKHSKKAFSIIEVLLVLLIVAVLVGIFVPATVRVREKVKADMIEKQLSTVISAGRTFMSERGVTQVDFKTLLSEKRLKPLSSVRGEKYDDIVIKEAGGTIKLEFPDGSAIERDY